MWLSVNDHWVLPMAVSLGIGEAGAPNTMWKMMFYLGEYCLPSSRLQVK